MYKNVTLGVLIIWSLVASGQNKSSKTTDLTSPYKSLKVFVNYTDNNNYQPEKASLVFNDSSLTEEEKAKSVEKLDQLLAGSGIIILLNEVPNDIDYSDSLSEENRYVLSEQYPNIFLSKQNGKWQFQSRSIKEIHKAHKNLFRFGSGLLISKNARKTYLGNSFLGLQVWQWMGIICFLVLGAFLRFMISLFFKRLMMQFLELRGKATVGEKYILPVSKPFGMLVVLGVLALFYPVLQLPGLVGHYLILVLKGLIPLYVVITLYRVVNILEVVLMKIAQTTTSTLDDQLVPLLKKVLRVLIVLIGGLIIMDNLEIPILPLLTGLSIGGLAFALAAQDTIKNFFGSLMIFIDKPFQIGDWISSGDIDGTVEEVGFRSTRVRTFRNSVVYVPNGKLADSVIDNNGLRLLRRFRMMIALKYDTPPDRIEVFVEGLKKLLHSHPKTNKKNYEIHLNQMNDSSLDVLFYIFFEAPSWSDELKFRQEIILGILRLGEKLSVHFAFPTQTVHVENLPGQQSLSPHYTLTKQDLDNRLKEYFDERASEENKK